MTRDELLARLKFLHTTEASDAYGDAEGRHWEADMALVEFINDAEVTEAFMTLEKWYA